MQFTRARHLQRHKLIASNVLFAHNMTKLFISTEIQNDDYQTYLASGRESSVFIYLPVGSAARNFTIDVIVKVADGRLFSTTSLHSVKVWIFFADFF